MTFSTVLHQRDDLIAVRAHVKFTVMDFHQHCINVLRDFDYFHKTQKYMKNRCMLKSADAFSSVFHKEHIHMTYIQCMHLEQ